MKQNNDDQNLKPERIQGTEKATPERRQEENGDAAAEIDRLSRTVFITVDASGVTVRLGHPPASGVTEAHIEIAATLTATS